MKCASAAACCVPLCLLGCGSDDTTEEPPGAVIQGDAEVILHPEQPMVVDVRLPLLGNGTIAASVATDPGARSRPLPAGPDGAAMLRLRGLQPATHYEATVTATLASGRSAEVAIAFDTPAPLTGFVTSFPPVTTSADQATEYRLFDVNAVQAFSTLDAGIFAIDPAGVTRFYLERVPHASYALVRGPTGLHLASDGTLYFSQDYDLFGVDELGVELWHVTAEQAGVAGFHHDVIRLPSGNYLALAFQFQMHQYPGQPAPIKVCGDELVEVTTAGDVVWRWSTFDHLDLERVPELGDPPVPDPADATSPGLDWTHANGVVHRASDDSLLLSLRHQDWLLLIDRASGAIKWKLGFEGDFALQSGTWFHHQHSPELQPDGSVVLYDNGMGNPDVEDASERTRQVGLSFDEQAHTAAQLWQDFGDDYFSFAAGDVNRLSNGHYSVLDSRLVIGGNFSGGTARLREIDPTRGVDVWRVDLPAPYLAYRAEVTPRLPGEAE